MKVQQLLSIKLPIILSSATTIQEALWLEERGADAIIAQGLEAGGHRGHFLSSEVTRQPGTFANFKTHRKRVKALPGLRIAD